MSGGNEVSLNTITAMSEGNTVYNTQPTILTATITYSGLRCAFVSWHICNATVDVSGSTIFDLDPPQLSSYVFTSTT